MHLTIVHINSHNKLFFQCFYMKVLSFSLRLTMWTLFPVHVQHRKMDLSQQENILISYIGKNTTFLNIVSNFFFINNSFDVFFCLSNQIQKNFLKYIFYGIASMDSSKYTLMISEYQFTNEISFHNCFYKKNLFIKYSVQLMDFCHGIAKYGSFIEWKAVSNLDISQLPWRNRD